MGDPDPTQGMARRIFNTRNYNKTSSKHHQNIITLLQTLRKWRTARGPVEKAKGAVEVANIELKMVMRYLEAPRQASINESARIRESGSVRNLISLMILSHHFRIVFGASWVSWGQLLVMLTGAGQSGEDSRRGQGSK